MGIDDVRPTRLSHRQYNASCSGSLQLYLCRVCTAIFRSLPGDDQQWYDEIDNCTYSLVYHSIYRAVAYRCHIRTKANRIAMLKWLRLTKNERIGLWIVIILAIILITATLWIRRSTRISTEATIMLSPTTVDSINPDSTNASGKKTKRRKRKGKPVHTTPDYNPFDHPLQ